MTALLESDLLPCPFCAGVRLDDHAQLHRGGIPKLEELRKDVGGGWRVICYNCEVKTYAYFAKASHAIARWNKRPGWELT